MKGNIEEIIYNLHVDVCLPPHQHSTYTVHFYQSGINCLAVLMKAANRGRHLLVYLGFSHLVLMQILLKQEQHGSVILFDSVPASWSLWETKAVWDI